MDNRYKRLFNNSIWTLIGNSGSKLLGFILLPLYTRWLGTNGFGESDLVTTYATVLTCIMTLSLSESIFVFTKNKKIDEIKVVYSTSLNFVLAILGIWLFLWIGLDFIFAIFDIHNSFSNNLWYIYILVVVSFLQQYSQQFILGIEKIRIYAFTGIVNTIMTFIFSYLLIPTMGVRGYIIGMICSSLTTALYSVFFTRSYQYLLLWKIDKIKLVEILKYSIPLIPNGIMWWLISAINRPMMEYYLDYSTIGIYAVANRFPGVITMIFSVFSVAWNISVFEEYGKPNFKEFYKKTFKMIFFVLTIASCGIIMLSYVIIKLFTAPEFIDAWKYMNILIIGAFFYCLSSFCGATFGVVKKSQYFFYSSIYGALSSVIFNLLLIPNYGLWGAAISVLLSYIVMSIARYIYSLKFIRISLIPCIIEYSIVLLSICAISYIVQSFAVRLLASSVCMILFVWLERRNLKSAFSLIITRIK